MGMVPIEWADILAWVQLTGTELYPEEARILRELSFAYVAQYTVSKDPDCPAPFFTDDSPVDSVKQQMARFKQKRQSK